MQMYEFEKSKIPDDPDEVGQFVENVMTFGVSMFQYKKAYEMEDIT